MAMPGYQEFMLPLLQIARDGEEQTVAGAMEALAERMKISEEDRGILLPSGTQTRFYNRVMWAITYLYKSQLLEKIGRGRFKIGARGLEILKGNPLRIDNAFLEQFEEYRAFKSKKDKTAVASKGDAHQVVDPVEPDITPDERMDAAYKELRETLGACPVCS